MSRFDYYPEHDRNKAGTFTAPQDSNFRLVGYPPSLKVPSADHNGKLNSAGEWIKTLDTTTLSNADWLSSSVGLLTSTRLTYAIGQSVLTGASVGTRGVYLIEGTRIETSDDFLNPSPAGLATGAPLIYQTATLPGRIWIYANTAGDIRFESVGPGTADAPAAGEQALAGVDVDAVGKTTANVAPSTSPLPAVPSLDVSLPIILDGAGTMLSVTGGSPAGDPAAIFASNFADAPAIQSTASVAHTATGLAALLGGSGRALYTRSTGAEPGARLEHTGAGAAASIVTTGAGEGLIVDTSGGAGRAIDAVGPEGAADIIRATCDTGAALRGVVTRSGVGVSGLGGPSAISVAVRGASQHVDAYAVEGVTAPGASVLSAAVRGLAFGDAAGLYGYATGDGYGAVLQADQAGPTRAALWLIPQDADPTTGDQGAFCFQNSRGPTGKLRTYTAQWESVHSSAKGDVRALSLSQSGFILSGNSVDIALIQITPEEVGNVDITIKGYLNWSADAASTSVQIRDVTLGATINSAGVVEYPRVGASGRGGSICVPINYTLPDTTTRTFAVRLTAAGGTTIYTDITAALLGLF